LETILAGKIVQVACFIWSLFLSKSVEINTSNLLPFAKLFEVSKDKNSCDVVSKYVGSGNSNFDGSYELDQIIIHAKR